MTVAVVTGAASGMGRACVELAADLAQTVVAVDVDDCDVTDAAAVRALAARVAEAGPFRALIHAAGISPTMGDARRVLEVNLVGTQLLLDAFEPLVVDGSAAVCFASSAAHQLEPFFTEEMEALVANPLAPDFLARATQLVAGDSGFAYALSKLGVIRAAARAAVRWGAKGGRVNSLSPGLIDTPMGRREFEQQPMMKDMLDSTPLGRFGTPDELAAVATFLVSDAASFVNGVDLLVDGGLLAASRQKPVP